MCSQLFNSQAGKIFSVQKFHPRKTESEAEWQWNAETNFVCIAKVLLTFFLCFISIYFLTRKMFFFSLCFCLWWGRVTLGRSANSKETSENHWYEQKFVMCKMSWSFICMRWWKFFVFGVFACLSSCFRVSWETVQIKCEFKSVQKGHQIH